MATLEHCAVGVQRNRCGLPSRSSTLAGVALAATLGMTPLSLCAEPWWKWGPSASPRTPTAAPSAAPKNGFAAAIHRLREEATQKAYAGDIDGAIAAAQRARKIAEASAGLVAHDPECTVEAANELVRKLMAIKVAAVRPSSARSVATVPSSAAASPPASSGALSATQPTPSNPPVAPREPVVVRPYGGAASVAEPDISLTGNAVPAPAAVPFRSWERPVSIFVPHLQPRVAQPPPVVAVLHRKSAEADAGECEGEAATTPDPSAANDQPTHNLSEETVDNTVLPPPHRADKADALPAAPRGESEALPQTAQLVPEAKFTATALTSHRPSDSPNAPPHPAGSPSPEALQSPQSPQSLQSHLSPPISPAAAITATSPAARIETTETAPVPQPAFEEKTAVTSAVWTANEASADRIAPASYAASPPVSAAPAVAVPTVTGSVEAASEPSVQVPAVWFREVTPPADLEPATSPTWWTSLSRTLVRQPQRALAAALAGVGLLLMGTGWLAARSPRETD
uniref:Uncharacterized protein n=1 Tax=Schlesneria paludicola TaxID=360056 RepID=A0A7C4QN61_9PLAN